MKEIVLPNTRTKEHAAKIAIVVSGILSSQYKVITLVSSSIRNGQGVLIVNDEYEKTVVNILKMGEK